MRTYTSAEACERSGLSYRQLDYWTRASAITPSLEATGMGSRREWSALDVARLVAVAEVARDLDDLGRLELVRELWARLADLSDVVLERGSLVVHAVREEVEA